MYVSRVDQSSRTQLDAVLKDRVMYSRLLAPDRSPRPTLSFPNSENALLPLKGIRAKLLQFLPAALKHRVTEPLGDALTAPVSAWRTPLPAQEEFSSSGLLISPERSGEPTAHLEARGVKS
ncbi:hypothetical protein EYF80_061377 [Liparis tanakae]|uniref:Uncharacterized protein n=1 Tax=Liparis tanakae TaxID=230148 RepID=A0A4Z2EI11_9TELE|nr:hypothetical protein EYF80_061377 [Liparis tanakae]